MTTGGFLVARQRILVIDGREHPVPLLMETGGSSQGDLESIPLDRSDDALSNRTRAHDVVLLLGLPAPASKLRRHNRRRNFEDAHSGAAELVPKRKAQGVNPRPEEMLMIAACLCFRSVGISRAER